MQQIFRVITSLILIAVAGLTGAFSFLQWQKSRLVDENLVANLTTQLNTQAVKQAVDLTRGK